MKPIFGRGPSLQLRLFFAVILSASLMLADSRLGAFAQVRYLLNSIVAPIQYMADVPRTMFDGLYERFNARQDVMESNRTLKREVLRLKNDVLLLDQYREENQRLRKLLGSSFVRDERKMVAEVMAVDTSPYRHQVVIDKGLIDGVYVGQPVANEKGIVGQVTFVSAHNSRVLLLTDSNSAIPVQVIRNDIRVIASGNSKVDTIHLDHIPISTDIQQGDLLVTSGLGGVYPEGYPVAYIANVERDSHREFALIEADPVVDFDRLRYLLLIWPSDSRQEKVQQADPNNMAEVSANGE
ncbi:rod shape-determining protein MreC [Vibrio scophthalmi]|uniref:Cell shape-determining protein MreC n=2 Tax=Vibrio scophthalmi TaxID=45658 RepID=F9RJ88_9VIBR|nr:MULTISPECIES: rod shape-determining protein MreC [Vibrio]EGU34722.1 rod shape-determining protein MreC [Vibrio sp. N418]EGU41016.1 rod shape-determining protein MreC [Vibrio scophthalmi LMG 19158]MCY9802948.1 rod shape-determining protein MreC [Vibrio scophthalmi]ODS10201.1 Cell shape-determining protein MreC [Vibrio scophthalmi]